MAFFSRLFSVIRFESIIHEFDPWFNYRATRKLVEGGFYEFLNWFDETAWYPLGRVVGGTVYPGIMVTAAAIHKVLNGLNFAIDIRNVCVFLAPMFSGLTAFATYLFTSELKNPSAGLLAAIFIGIAPGYISRSVAGSYDNEGIAIFLLMITFYFWIKAVKTGSSLWACVAAMFYFYMVSAWGGYVFIINLIPMHVFALLLMGRFSNKLYAAYSTFYVLGTLSSMTIPFVGFQPTRTSEHMAAFGIFGLIQLIAIAETVRAHVESNQFKILLRASVVALFVLGFLTLVALTLSGVIAPWTGRFYSLWDTGYASKYIPIIASVSEHQPTPWTSWFFDLQWLIFLFPAGIYICFQKLKDEHIFVILYAITASYFSSVMVRLMLTLTPVVCVGAALALSDFLDVYLREYDTESMKKMAEKSPVDDKPNIFTKMMTGKKSDEKYQRKKAQASKKPQMMDGIWFGYSRSVAILPIIYLMFNFVWHCTYVTSSAYSSPSVVLASRNQDGSQYIIDDFREAYYWLRQNSAPDSKVMSWWDYGYQIAGMADRPTLVDNNTWNNTHIATVGKAMSSPEDVSYEILKKHDVSYVLVIFGGMLGYSGDDINKFLWMIRISQGIWPDEVIEKNFFTPRGEYRVDEGATETMKSSLMYKMSYYRFGELYGQGGIGVDRVRGQRVPTSDIKLDTLEEAYTTEHMIVRVYKVKPLDSLGRPLVKKSDRKSKKPRVNIKPDKTQKPAYAYA